MGKAPAGDPKQPEGTKMTGYKWTRGKKDNVNYTIKLLCSNAFNDPMISDAFYTTDCIVESITDECGNEVEQVDGKAFAEFFYRKGQRITGHQIYFFKSESMLKMKYEQLFSILDRRFKAIGELSKTTDKHTGITLCLKKIEII